MATPVMPTPKTAQVASALEQPYWSEGQFEQHKVTLKEGNEVGLMLRKDQASRAYFPAFCLLSNFRTSTAEDVGELKKMDEMQIISFDLPSGRKESVALCFKKLGRFSLIAFCVANPESQGPETGVAVKIPQFDKPDQHSQRLACEGVMDEIRLLKKLRHPNLVDMLGYLHSGDASVRPLLIMPCYNGDISNKLPVESLKRQIALCIDLMRGLDYLHSQSYCHRDIKPQNCLLGFDGTLSICDLVTVKKIGADGCYLGSSEAGSKGYWPDETRVRNTDGKRVYGSKGDVFSGAVMMLRITDLSDTEYDRLVSEAKLAPTDEDRNNMYSQAEKILAEDMPVLPVFHPANVILKDTTVGGYPMNNPQNTVYSRNLYRTL